MKFLLLLIVVAVSGAAGYLTEPNFRLQLTGIPADFKKSESDPKSKPDSKSKPETEDEIPFETNPVAPTTPTVVDPTPDPVVPTPPDTVPTTPTTPTIPTTPTTPPEVVTEIPEAPVTPPEAPLQAADVVLVMKSSIASGDVSKFSAAQVLEWKAGEATETIDGETYQIGNLTYQAETPFGTKNLPAKALIKNGKVVRWISPKSGMKID